MRVADKTRIGQHQQFCIATVLIDQFNKLLGLIQRIGGIDRLINIIAPNDLYRDLGQL